MEAHYVYLLALASKTEARGSPERDTLCYSRRHLWPDLDVAKLLSRGLVFHINQVIQLLFSIKISYYTIYS